MSAVNQLLPVDYSEFAAIVEELKRLPIEVNRYRNKVGIGRSQCFGIVSKRSMCPDLSRQSWRRPYLHHLLMEYARKHVEIPFTSIQVNENLACEEHKDRGNVGLSYIVGFGDYPEGGGLWIDGRSYDIRHRPLLFDGSKLPHKTEVWRGNRFTIVFHTILPKPSYRDLMPPLSVYEAFLDIENNKWKIRDVRDGSVYFGKIGLPHPLKGYQRKAVLN